MPIRNRLGAWERKRLKELMHLPAGSYDHEELDVLEAKAKQEETWWVVLWPLGFLFVGSALMGMVTDDDVRRPLAFFLGGLFVFCFGVWMMVLVIRVGGTDEGEEKAATAARMAEEYYAKRRKRKASGRKSTGH